MERHVRARAVAERARDRELVRQSQLRQARLVSRPPGSHRQERRLRDLGRAVHRRRARARERRRRRVHRRADPGRDARDVRRTPARRLPVDRDALRPGRSHDLAARCHRRKHAVHREDAVHGSGPDPEPQPRRDVPSLPLRRVPSRWSRGTTPTSSTRSAWTRSRPVVRLRRRSSPGDRIPTRSRTTCSSSSRPRRPTSGRGTRRPIRRCRGSRSPSAWARPRASRATAPSNRSHSSCKGGCGTIGLLRERRRRRDRAGAAVDGRSSVRRFRTKPSISREMQNANGDWVAPTADAINKAVDAGGDTPLYALTNKVPGRYPLVWVDHLYAPAHGLSIEKTEGLAMLDPLPRHDRPGEGERGRRRPAVRRRSSPRRSPRPTSSCRRTASGAAAASSRAAIPDRSRRRPRPRCSRSDRCCTANR